MLSSMMLMAALVLGTLLAAIPHILWLVGWIVAKCLGHTLSYAPFGWTALALVLLCWMILAYGFYIGRWQTVVNHIEYSHPSVPAAFDGYRIVHISDLHLSTFDDQPKRLNRLVERINAEQPDLICFTGDLVTLGREEAEPYTGALRRLSATDGVMSVMGNHDMLIYGLEKRSEEQRMRGVEEVAAYQREVLGWHLLRNEHYSILRPTSKVGDTASNDSITIIGVDNTHGSGQGFHTIDMGNLSQAAANTEGCRILLSHDPSHWEAETIPTTDIPLTLSGHTHAAQIRLLGWNLSSPMFRQSAGRYDIGDQTIYVNAGLGCTLPVRIACPAEITVITLHSKQ